MPAVDPTAEYAQWCVAIVIEGLPYVWVSHEDLVGSNYFGMDRTVLPGLVPPDYSIGIDPLADFQFKRSKTKIKIEDFGGELARSLNNFDVSDAEPLATSIEPGDDLSGRPELHGMQLGPEAIGPAGERGQYPVIDGWHRAQLHAGEDLEVSHASPTPVSKTPLVLDGRRVMLYRIWRDVTTFPETMGLATWRPWNEAQRPWWGTLRRSGHQVDGRIWSLACDGPESWVYKRVGHTTQDRRVKVLAPLHLSEEPGSDQTRAYVRCTSKRRGNNFYDIYGLDDFGSQISGTTTAELRLSLASIVQIAASAIGPAGIFVDNYGHNVKLDGTGSILVTVNEYPDSDERMAVVEIALHERVWMALGFWPYAQKRIAYDDELYVDFERLDGNAPSGTAPPGSGYWLGRFSTRALDSLDFALEANADAVDLDNGGQWRPWKPRYEGGTIIITPDLAANQEILLDDDVVHHAGQLDQPSKPDPEDVSQPYFGGNKPRQGLWAIRGPRRWVNDEDEFEETQVVRATWQEAGLDLAEVRVGSESYPEFVVQRFEDPAAFGFNRALMTSDWVAVQNDPAKTLYAYPLLRWGYGAVDGQDQAHVVLQRFLLTTGLSQGWDGFEGGGPTLAATSNEPAGAGLRLDADHIDMGAAIPSSMVDPPQAWLDHAERLGSLGLRTMSLAVTPGMETEAILRGIMAPRGWGWSLAGGRYGLLDYSATPSPENVVVLDWSVKATGEKLREHLTKQGARAFQPKDEYLLEYAWNPINDEFRRTAKMRSPDRGARYRPKPIEELGEESRRHNISQHTIQGYGIQNSGGWYSRMARVARWMDRGQFWLKGYKVTRDVGFQIWPGTQVALTEPRAVGPTGEYGVDGALGIVTDVSVKQGGRETILDILVDASPYGSVRYCAPSARGRGYDPATRRLYLEDDHLNSGDVLLDATAFVEPSWSNVGGLAQIQVHQFDGHDWTLTCTGVVESMSNDAGDSYLVIAGAGLSGTYRRDDDAIVTLRPMDQQTAPWVLTLFAPTCDEQGEWNAPAERGPKWAA